MNENNTYIIQRNPQYGSIEIEFGDIPSDAVKATISCMGMRYNSARHIWYGVGISEADLREAVEDAMAGRKGRFAPGDGTEYEITRNADFDSVEVKFNGKPSDAVRQAVRGLGMRWHKIKCCWYSRYVTEDQVRAAIAQAMGA